MIQHIYADEPGNGITIYGRKLDNLIPAVSEDLSNFELGFGSSKELWQAHKALRRGESYVLTLHDVPIIVGKPFSPWFGSGFLSKSIRKILDLTIGSQIIRRIVKQARKVAVINPSAASVVAAKFHINPEKIVQIPHPIILSAAGTKKPASQELQILYFGNISPFKGVDLLIEAIIGSADLKTSHTKIVGKAGSYRKYEDDLRNKCVNIANIEFFGYASDDQLLQLISESDVIVLPYRLNGLIYASGPLYAGMASGKALVVSDLSIFTSEITHGYNGLVFKLDDAQDLRQMLELLASDKALAKRLGEYARQDMVKQHSDTVIVGRLRELYSK